jgi:pyridoxine kinase
VDIIAQTFDLLRDENTLVVVDPVMADNGKLYKIFPENFPDAMRKLCTKADVIVPNLTEAALLLNEPHHDGPNTKEEINRMLRALSAIGPKRVVVTGVSLDGVNLGAACFDAAKGETEYAFAPRIDPMFHGTGDVFASVLVSALLHGRTLAQAAEVAVRFTVDSIARTKALGIDIRFGVVFETGLEELKQWITG